MIRADISFVLAHLLQSTFCVFAAWLLTLALKNNRASARYWVWLAASVKFLIPFSLLVSASSELGSLMLPSREQPQVFSVMEEISRPLMLSNPTPMLSGSVHTLHPVLPFLFGVWLCGFVIAAIYWLMWWRRIRAALRSATPLHLNLSIPAMSFPGRLEPGVFGIRKPVLLLPEGITRYLTPDQLATIVEHELCHVRRRDNLTAAIHMVVEAIFWFYPPVWWIRMRLIEERERACDEAVLQTGSAADVYAESILNVCKFYIESPLACASGVTGSDLKKRITRILAGHAVRRLGWPGKLLLASAGAALLSLPIVFGLLHATRTWAQAVVEKSNQLPKFEVTTVKPSEPGATMVMTKFTPDGIQIKNAPLILILRQATGLLNSNDDQIFGAPSWVKTARYDIDAKVDESDVPKLDRLSRIERNEMMWSVLVDRFKFAAHRETRELPVFELVVAKGGSKLKEATPGDTYPNGLKNDQGQSSPGMMRVGLGTVDCQAIPIANLLETLTQLTGRTVVDRTGLTGKYDIKLRWTPEDLHQASEAGGTAEETAVDFFTAVQEQLGLTFKSAKGPVDALVVDRIEKPSEN
ncbi:MAG TPA: M56 family metallopeptidase [Candidatus Angelobacter sp.]